MVGPAGASHKHGEGCMRLFLIAAVMMISVNCSGFTPYGSVNPTNAIEVAKNTIRTYDPHSQVTSTKGPSILVTDPWNLSNHSYLRYFSYFCGLTQ